MTCHNQLEVSIHLRKIANYIHRQLRCTGGPHSVGVGPSKTNYVYVFTDIELNYDIYNEEEINFDGFRELKYPCLPLLDLQDCPSMQIEISCKQVNFLSSIWRICEQGASMEGIIHKKG